MNIPELSVVIPVYSRGLELAHSIESVLAQTYQNFEIVLVDNNAKDVARSTAKNFVERFPEKIRLVKESDQGVCSARNTGILKSLGSFIALQDEDDLMKPNRLEAQIKILKKRTDISLVTCFYDIISPDGKSIIKKNIYSPTVNAENSYGKIAQEIRSLFSSYMNSNISSTFHFHIPSSYMFRKELAIRAGLFDTRFNPQFLEDYEFQIRMFAEGPFFQVQDSLFSFRENPHKFESDSSQKTPEKYQVHEKWHLNDQIFFISLWNRFSNISKKNIPILKRIRAILLRSIGSHAVRFSDGGSIAATLFLRSWLANPKDIGTLKLYIKTFFPKTYYPHLFWFDRFSNESLEKLPKGFSRTILHNAAAKKRLGKPS